MAASMLPQRPDPDSGQPAPPDAPAYHGPSRTPKTRSKIGIPKPPSGMGPTVAWHSTSLINKIRRYLIAVVILAAICVLIDLLYKDPPFFLLRHWATILVIVFLAWPMSGSVAKETQSVGADWFQWTYRRFWFTVTRREFVHTYDLEEVTAYIAGVNTYIKLRDIDGSICYKSRDELQRDRTIWNFVYNGILHSIANGAKMNEYSVQALELNKTPVLRVRADNLLADNDDQ